MLGLDSDGTVAVLKARVKAARDGIPEPVKMKPKKVKKAKTKDLVPVLHTHELTEELVEGCGLCESHGNLDDTHVDFEAAPDLKARLKAILDCAETQLLEEPADDEDDEDEELDGDNKVMRFTYIDEEDDE